MRTTPASTLPAERRASSQPSACQTGPVTRSRPTWTVGARNGRGFPRPPHNKKILTPSFRCDLQRGALAIIHLETSSAKTSAHASVGCRSGEKYHRVSVDLSGMRAHITGIIDTNLILGA